MKIPSRFDLDIYLPEIVQSKEYGNHRKKTEYQRLPRKCQSMAEADDKIFLKCKKWSLLRLFQNIRNYCNINWKKPQFTDFYIYDDMHKKTKTKDEIYENINNRW